MQTADKKTKIQILTLEPKSWSIEKTAHEFGVSECIVRNARILKKNYGILANPEGKRGKTLQEDIQNKVIEFFQDDEFSRLCPGKKDYVSVKIKGERVQMQKRLLLCNLKEMHIAYKERNGLEIGFTKFCELRPKWCVTVSSSGSHSVCVQYIKMLS